VAKKSNILTYILFTLIHTHTKDGIKGPYTHIYSHILTYPLYTHIYGGIKAPFSENLFSEAPPLQGWGGIPFFVGNKGFPFFFRLGGALQKLERYQRVLDSEALHKSSIFPDMFLMYCIKALMYYAHEASGMRGFDPVYTLLFDLYRQLRTKLLSDFHTFECVGSISAGFLWTCIRDIRLISRRF